MLRIFGEVGWVLGAELAKRDIFPHILPVFVHDPGPVLTLLAGRDSHVHGVVSKQNKAR
jgi:hypothetical protein